MFITWGLKAFIKALWFDAWNLHLHIYDKHLQNSNTHIAMYVGHCNCKFDIKITFTFVHRFAIQITMCAEYRNMLPRPRLVLSGIEPGMRPIGRTVPGVSDKSRRDLGSMCRYSAHLWDLNLFYSIPFQFLKSSVGGVGALQLWDGSVTFHHCYSAQNEAPAKDNEISQHPFEFESLPQTFKHDNEDIIMKMECWFRTKITYSVVTM